MHAPYAGATRSLRVGCSFVRSLHIVPVSRGCPLSQFSPHDLWVFGYGSLMWRPGFDYIARRPARLIGAHRALCVYSFIHRGTPEKPGLVLGLDHGGACQGIAFCVAAKNRDATLAYLRERELINHVYHEVMRSIWLEDDARSQVSALCYVVDRRHPQYAGRLTLEQQLHFVRQGHGKAGPCRDYVLSTVTEMEAHGCRDSELHRLAAMLRENMPARAS